MKSGSGELVLRGGAYYHSGSTVLAAQRSAYDGNTSNHLGFRVVLYK